MSTKVQLQVSSVLHLPIQDYQQDFVFIVNNMQFYTSRIAADLLSPKIAQLHQVDPTTTSFLINTKASGDFNAILSLITFKDIEIKEKDIPFFSEILNSLEISLHDIKVSTEEKTNNSKSTLDNLVHHLQFPLIYQQEIEKEIEKISEDFYQLKENEKEKQKFISLPTKIIELIFGHTKLQLESEDQLVEIINDLYKKDRDCCYLYSLVDFRNVTAETMKEFVKIINQEDITRDTWLSLTARLCEEIKFEKKNEKKYMSKKMNSNFVKEILYTNQIFDGLLNYLKKQSSIQNEVVISYSSLQCGNPQQLLNYEDRGNYCYTKNEPDSWFCFEFKNHEIIPTNYTIGTQSGGPNCNHLKNWILEGSKDKVSWTKLDEEKNCSYLNGSCFYHTFPIQNENHQSFKYLRIHQTGQTWYNNYNLLIGCVEFYGQLV